MSGIVDDEENKSDDESDDDELSNCDPESEERTKQLCRSSNGKFRTYDGSCNNANNPHWGQADTAFQRILQPEYEDGKLEPLILFMVDLVGFISDAILQCSGYFLSRCRSPFLC